MYLFKSSNPSLNIERVITTTKGVIAEIGFNGDIVGIDYNIATNKK